MTVFYFQYFLLDQKVYKKSRLPEIALKYSLSPTTDVLQAVHFVDFGQSIHKLALPGIFATAISGMPIYRKRLISKVFYFQYFLFDQKVYKKSRLPEIAC